MQIVDTDKLTRQRDMIDADITALVLERGLSRPTAYFTFCGEQTQQNLVMTSGPSGWWSGITVPPLGQEKARETAIRLLSAPEEDRQRVAEKLVGQAVFATVPENVATALLLRWVDPDCDLFLDDHIFQQIYVRDEWRRVADAVPFRHILESPEQRIAGETYAQYAERLLLQILVLRMQSIVLQPLRLLLRETS